MGMGRRSGRAWRWARQRSMLACAGTACLLAACAGGDVTAADAPPTVVPEVAPRDAPGASDADPDPAPARPERPEPDPFPIPELPDPPPSDGGDAVPAGVVLTRGYAPHPHLRGEDGVVVWPDETDMPQAVGDPPVPEGLGPLAITAAIDRWRLSCTWWERRIVGVDVGDDAVAARIADGIVAAAVARHQQGWARWFASEADCEGTDPSSPVGQGTTYQELSEEPCVLPGGPPLRCFLLADFGYPAGAAHTYLGLDQLVFDATTGEQLGVEEVLRVVGLDPVEVEAVVDDLICRLDFCWGVEVERVRPTADALVFPFAPYEAGPFSVYTRELTVPWEVLVTPDA